MTLDDRLQRAIDTLGEKFNEKFRDELTRELQSLSEDLKAQAPPAPEPPPPPPPDNSAIVRLADAVRALDTAASLSEVLDTLATAAGNESARAGVFVIRDGALHGVKLIGFPTRYEEAPVLPLSDAGVLYQAVTEGVLAMSTASPFDELPPDVQAIAIPLVLAGTSVGALYVEGADVPTMEILTRFASRALEALTAIKTARAIAEGV